MATKIRLLPTLIGKTAKEFIDMADKALINKNTVDFSKQVHSAYEILKKFYLISFNSLACIQSF